MEFGTVPPDHPSAIAAGRAALEEEQSVDYSIGIWLGSRGNGRHAAQVTTGREGDLSPREFNEGARGGVPLAYEHTGRGFPAPL